LKAIAVILNLQLIAAFFLMLFSDHFPRPHDGPFWVVVVAGMTPIANLIAILSSRNDPFKIKGNI